MQKRLAFANGHGGNRKYDWARRQRRKGLRCPVPHRTRKEVQERFPMHVTMRVREGLGSLRKPRVYAAVREALARSKRSRLRMEFRVHQFSVQSNHLHLIVEACDRVVLSRGMQGLATRMAMALNKAWGRRGKVFAERYHALALRSARQVRNALRYVLNNALKHGRIFGSNRPDPCSSGRWFDGWRRGRRTSALPSPVRSPTDAHSPVVAARGFLLRVAWRRLGLLDPSDGPRGSL